MIWCRWITLRRISTKGEKEKKEKEKKKREKLKLTIIHCIYPSFISSIYLRMIMMTQYYPWILNKQAPISFQINILKKAFSHGCKINEKIVLLYDFFFFKAQIIFMGFLDEKKFGKFLEMYVFILFCGVNSTSFSMFWKIFLNFWV
jgi:hypothetical protein